MLEVTLALFADTASTALSTACLETMRERGQCGEVVEGGDRSMGLQQAEAASSRRRCMALAPLHVLVGPGPAVTA
jgi:hypothetical protein